MPEGLYWYHPHIHGISEPAVQGGATGAIIVDGLENAPEALMNILRPNATVGKVVVRV